MIRLDQILLNTQQVNNNRMDKIFTTYWAPISFILLGLGWMITNYFQGINKQKEMKSALFYQNKIDAVNSFFLAYSNTINMFQRIDYRSIISGKMSAEEIDDKIWPPMYDLRSSGLLLRTYFEPEEHKHFESVLSSLLDISDELLKEVVSSHMVKAEEHINNAIARFYVLKSVKLMNADAQLSVLSSIIQRGFLEKKEKKCYDSDHS